MQVELDNIRKTVGLVLGRRNVAASDRLIEDLRAESADILNVIVTIEEEYGITIDETSVPSIRTVADLYDLVRHTIA
jgi:acyl carrier protein